MQKHVEVDEPEPSEVPMISAVRRHDDGGRDQPEDQRRRINRMTEEDLMRGLEGLPPAESPGSQRYGY